MFSDEQNIRREVLDENQQNDELYELAELPEIVELDPLFHQVKDSKQAVNIFHSSYFDLFPILSDPTTNQDFTTSVTSSIDGPKDQESNNSSTAIFHKKPKMKREYHKVPLYSTRAVFLIDHLCINCGYTFDYSYNQVQKYIDNEYKQRKLGVEKTFINDFCSFYRIPLIVDEYDFSIWLVRFNTIGETETIEKAYTRYRGRGASSRKNITKQEKQNIIKDVLRTLHNPKPADVSIDHNQSVSSSSVEVSSENCWIQFYQSVIANVSRTVKRRAEDYVAPRYQKQRLG